MSEQASDETAATGLQTSELGPSSDAEGPDETPEPAPSARRSTAVEAAPKQDPRQWFAAVLIMLFIAGVLFLFTQWLRG